MAQTLQRSLLPPELPSIPGTELAARLRRHGVVVAPGGPLGAADYVRITVRDEPATDRLLAALGKAFGG